MEVLAFTSGEIDLAIRYGAGPYPGLKSIRLMHETVIPVMSPDLAEREPVANPPTSPVTCSCTTARPTPTRAAPTGRCGSRPVA